MFVYRVARSIFSFLCILVLRTQEFLGEDGKA